MYVRSDISLSVRPSVNGNIITYYLYSRLVPGGRSRPAAFSASRTCHLLWWRQLKGTTGSQSYMYQHLFHATFILRLICTFKCFFGVVWPILRYSIKHTKKGDMYQVQDSRLEACLLLWAKHFHMQSRILTLWHWPSTHDAGWPWRGPCFFTHKRACTHTRWQSPPALLLRIMLKIRRVVCHFQKCYQYILANHEMQVRRGKTKQKQTTNQKYMSISTLIAKNMTFYMLTNLANISMFLNKDTHSWKIKKTPQIPRQMCSWKCSVCL